MKLSCSIISPHLAAPSPTDGVLPSPEPLFSLGPSQTNKESEWHEHARGGHRLWPETQDKERHRNLQLAFRGFFFTVLFHLGFPGGSVVKNLPANAGEVGSIPGSGRSPGEGNGNPLQYSCLENPRDRGAWQATVHGVAEELDMTKQLSNNYITVND